MARCHRCCWSLCDRLLRLGIPLLVYGFVLGPVAIALAQTARGKPFLDTLQRLWSRGEFEKGPMWVRVGIADLRLWRGDVASAPLA
jgi:hypothetical protein